MSRKSDKGLSSAMRALLMGIAVLGVIVLYRELPAMRRYWRIEHM